jgi:hypothetical protein
MSKENLVNTSCRSKNALHLAMNPSSLALLITSTLKKLSAITSKKDANSSPSG